MTSAEAVMAIMVACDACDDREYELAAKILADVPTVVIRTRDAGVHFGKLVFIANAQHGCYRVTLPSQHANPIEDLSQGCAESS